MKKLLTLAAGAALSLSIFAGGEKASANSEEITDFLPLNLFKEHILESIKEDYPNAQFVDLTPKGHEQQKQLSHTLSITPFASAPPLTYLEVYAAWSSNYGDFEYFNPNQLSSNIDHGGEKLYIVTAELGYGHIRTAKINGVHLKEYDRLHIDTNGDTIVDGWYILWNASGYENGAFTYQNTSSNAPWNTMSDNMYIK